MTNSVIDVNLVFTDSVEENTGINATVPIELAGLANLWHTSQSTTVSLAHEILISLYT